MSYADGFVLVVPKKNINAYRRLAQVAGKVWKKHGALQYFECIGEDLMSPCGVPFPKLMKTKSGETVMFSWILYKSRAHRDKVNAKVMQDPALMKWMTKKMPFDMKRMSHGGFETLVKA